MRLSVERLSAEVLDYIKKWYAKREEADCMPENGLTIGRLLDTIEALQQENEQLQEFANTKAEGRLVKRGKWIYEHKWKCSSCGWAQSHDFNTIPNDILKYCPNCGAKMSKEEAEKALEGSEWER
jgi:rubredoxin